MFIGLCVYVLASTFCFDVLYAADIVGNTDPNAASAASPSEAIGGPKGAATKLPADTPFTE